MDFITILQTSYDSDPSILFYAGFVVGFLAGLAAAYIFKKII